MFTKSIIEELLNDLESNQVLELSYSGFIGRGINGVSAVSMIVKSNYNNYGKVGYNKNYIYLVDLVLKDDYIKATYNCEKLDRHDAVISESDNYSTVITYDNIASVDIYTIDQD